MPGNKVAKDVKEEIEKKIKELKEILDKGTKEELEEKTAALSESLQKIGQAMYGKDVKTESSNVKSEEKPEDKKEDKKNNVEEGEVVN